MKVLEHMVLEDGFEFVRLMCNTQDDLWQMYNIVHSGDRVEALTTRKVGGCRVRCTLEVLVTSTEFDPAYDGIRFRGYTTYTHVFAEMGSSHTLQIEINRPFKVTKKRWLPIDYQRIESSLQVRLEDAMAAVVLHEGVAQICVLKRNMTIVKATVKGQVARKRSGFGAGHEESVQEFLETAAKTFMRHIKVEDMKAVILAGRGFIHNSFLKTLKDVADQMNQPITKKQREKFVLVTVSSGYKHSVKEILNSPDTVKALANTVAREEVKAIDRFMRMVMDDPSRAFYGFKHVAMANEFAAIDTLLISDALLRSNDIEERKKYSDFVEDVKLNKGKVLVFSSFHPSGEQLNMMTGIAAILRYPLVELEDEDMDDNEKDWSKTLAVQNKKDDLKIKEFIKNEFPELHAKLMERAAIYKNRGKGGYVRSGLSDDESDVEEEDETDTEQPPPRPYMTLGDCIVGKR
uniref:ERF1_1 domain-containing protein n=1 Tax=Panagrellus redivivus TaxID=6233 RepID=A0A7E4V485_PANRE